MRVEIRLLAPMLPRPPVWLWTVNDGCRELAWGLSNSEEDALSEAKLARQGAEWRLNQRAATPSAAGRRR